jgi:hypothetical protein
VGGLGNTHAGVRGWAGLEQAGARGGRAAGRLRPGAPPAGLGPLTLTLAVLNTAPQPVEMPQPRRHTFFGGGGGRAVMGVGRGGVMVPTTAGGASLCARRRRARARARQKGLAPQDLRPPTLSRGAALSMSATLCSWTTVYSEKVEVPWGGGGGERGG